MTVDLLLIILEHLTFLDLLDVAQTSKYFAFLSSYVFRQKLAHKTIEIGSFNKGITELLELDIGSELESAEVGTKAKAETKTTIVLENYDLVLSTFQTFGADIKNLKIDFRAMAPEIRHQIYQLITRYCSDTLKSLYLNQCDENTLSNFVVPMTGLEVLTMTSVLGSSKNSFQLNEIFPNLVQLNLQDVNILDSNVLDVNMPRLTQFSVTVSIIHVEIYEIIETFIKRNAQIRDLSLNYINSFNYLKLASGHLKDLERLQLNLAILTEDYTGPKIHFGNVKHLKMNWGSFDFSDVLSFNELESLDLTGDGSECSEFAGQFGSHLTELHLGQRDIEQQDSLSLVEKLPKLEELFISSASDFEEEDIFQVIEASHNLQKFTLKFHYGDFYDALRKRFGKEWDVQERALEHDVEVSMMKKVDWIEYD